MGCWCPRIALCVAIALCSVNTSMIAARSPQDDGTYAPASVLAQFLSATDEPLRSYQGRRILWARNARFNKEARVNVSVRFDEEHGLAFDVLESGGSPAVVWRALMPMLEGEVRMWRDGDPQKYALIPDHYEFLDPAPTDGDVDEIRIGMRPRQKHPLLIDGAIYLSASSSDLLRVEGRLSKNPSFWVTRVDIIRRYARIRGVRVPVELQTVAHVRLVGRSEMHVQYFYESVNGQPVEEP